MHSLRLRFERNVNRLFYKFSAPYYNILDSFGRFFSLDNEDLRHHLMDKLDVKEDEKIIDIGCGTGLQIPYYPDENQVYCVDINKGPLKRAKRKAKKLGKNNIEFSIGDATDLEFERDSFDIAILVHALSTIPGSRYVMNQTIKVVKHGGRIGILDFNHSSRHPFFGTTYLQLDDFVHNLFNAKIIYSHISSSSNKYKEDIYILEVDKKK